MLADLIDVRIFTLLLGLFIKVETVVELGFELTTSGLQAQCSTAGPHNPKLFGTRPIYTDFNGAN